MLFCKIQNGWWQPSKKTRPEVLESDPTNGKIGRDMRDQETDKNSKKSLFTIDINTGLISMRQSAN